MVCEKYKTNKQINQGQDFIFGLSLWVLFTDKEEKRK